MIVRTTPGGTLHVTQADHARFAGDLLRLFRLPEVAGHPRRQALLRAVSEHDNGWWEADAAPQLAADGLAAVDFRSLTAPARQAVWRRGVERFADREPYLAALVAIHSLGLAGRWGGEGERADFRAAMVVRRDELLEACGENLATLESDARWLAFADSLSLAVCTGEAGFLALPGWRIELREPPDFADLELALAPFPFAGATVFELSCRTLARGKFASDTAVGVALATATWQRLRVRLSPL